MKICPRCGSESLEYQPWLGEIYQCKDCGYRGSFIIEDGKLSKEIRKEFKRGKREKAQKLTLDKKAKMREKMLKLFVISILLLLIGTVFIRIILKIAG